MPDTAHSNSSDSSRIAVMVVHGVGNPVKGGTLNEFTLGFTSQLQPGPADAAVETIDSHLIVDTPTPREPDAVYQAPATRFSIGRTNYLAAELFWGDLSQIKPGLFNLLRGLFDLLYGLPGIIRHMLRDASSGCRHSSFPWFRLALLLANSTITGPILALSLLGLTAILVSALVYVAKPIVLNSCSVERCLWFDASVFLFGFSLLAFSAGRLRHWFARHGWSRQTLIYLFYFSMVAAFFMLISVPGHAFTDYLSPYVFMEVLPLSIVLLWILAATINGVAVALLLWVRHNSKRDNNNSITAAFILTELSFCLWALFTAALFYMLFKILPGGYFNDYLSNVCANCDVFSLTAGTSGNTGLIKIPLDVVRLLMLPYLVLIVTAVVFVWTRFAQPADRHPRLILPDALYRWILFLTIMIVCVMMIVGWMLAMSIGTNNLRPPDLINHLAMGLMFATIVTIIFFHRQIGHGLDIGLDVANYWRADRIGILSELLPPVLQSLQSTSTAAASGVVGKLNQTDRTIASLRVFTGQSGSQAPHAETSTRARSFGFDIVGFYKRHQMRVRFVATFRALLATRPDHLLIVSHSQGTMIAIDGLQHLIEQILDPSLDEPRSIAERIHLVTMGSPYQHLYGHYFGQTHPSNPFDRYQPYHRWLNIYRSNDYIGTQINGPPDINNASVGPRGHTDYWRDREVLEHLQRHLDAAGVPLC